MKTITLTPTWSGLMPLFVAAIEHGTSEGRANAISELNRLAAVVDETNERSKDYKSSPLGKKVAFLKEKGAVSAGEILRNDDKIAVVTPEGRVEWFNVNQFGGVFPELVVKLTTALAHMLDTCGHLEDETDYDFSNERAVLAEAKGISNG